METYIEAWAKPTPKIGKHRKWKGEKTPYLPHSHSISYSPPWQMLRLQTQNTMSPQHHRGCMEVVHEVVVVNLKSGCVVKVRVSKNNETDVFHVQMLLSRYLETAVFKSFIITWKYLVTIYHHMYIYIYYVNIYIYMALQLGMIRIALSTAWPFLDMARTALCCRLLRSHLIGPWLAMTCTIPVAMFEGPTIPINTKIMSTPAMRLWEMAPILTKTNGNWTCPTQIYH